MASDKAKAPERNPPVDHTDVNGSDTASEADIDALASAAGPSEAGSAHASGSSKKKKKKRSKAAKILSTLKGNEHGDVPGADEETIRQVLNQLKIQEVLQGKSGLGGKNKKDAGDHKFWATQPVPHYNEEAPEDDGPIEPSKPREEVRQEPYPLPKDFEWSILDIEDPAQLREVYELLSANYVEDDIAAFRFQYTAEFLEWALKPPGWHKEWHIGVRVSSNRKLVAFISGVPLSLRVRGNMFPVSEINYLCIHKKLRSKRLAPVLIKEVTRQCHLKGIFQAIYTAGVLLPTPVSTCRYYHRTLNVPKLVDVKFTFVPRHMTIARMIRQYQVPSKPHLASSGLREMEERDVEGVTDLFARYMRRFDMAPEMTLDDVRHQLLSGRGRGEVDTATNRREGQVTWTYVVESPETKKITDFFSFYTLPSTIMSHAKHNLLEAAYLFYYATSVAEEDPDDKHGLLTKRLQTLVGDAVIVANEAKFDVFNALTLMDNATFLQELKFGSGDGLLNFYLYNWRTKALAGVNPTADQTVGRGVGVVML
ncbi:hypothetical protein EVG20_g4072 [Dentipellis fragilis]|uniref:Glycylpeptide N-tetradecanoyltransferase n=1 Tax=Dentipellis fragilis TaxID=205917 RepID=A0A4Y9YZR5_9AGAM|nr:hypothetical protein EVG20_g4072 [Dentipellis fragilis]